MCTISDQGGDGMDTFGEWFLLAEGDVLSYVKDVAALRLFDEFGMLLWDLPDDQFRIDLMRNADRFGCSYRMFIKRATLEAHQRGTPS
ncbi:hypothetical protein GCM10027610_014120 [Dactylosporangium cerinum]